MELNCLPDCHRIDDSHHIFDCWAIYFYEHQVTDGDDQRRILLFFHNYMGKLSILREFQNET